MAKSIKRQRRLWDAYAFAGFRALPAVRGIFGEPKARVITLVRRSKKRSVAPAGERNRAGTTAGRASKNAENHPLDSVKTQKKVGALLALLEASGKPGST